MSHVVELTDEEYAALRQAAEERGLTMSGLVTALVEELRRREDEALPHAYSTEEWFRHLGATDEQIAEARRIARERADANS